jgi:metal-responsive CopG/Arc/MetJ family transcriptional regulator
LVKIAIGIPEATLKAVEEARRNTGESRSEFLRRAAEAMLRHEHRPDLIARYIEGYRQLPETLEDTLIRKNSQD